MRTINPIVNRKPIGQAALQQPESTKQRKVRSDKKNDVKFPVTDDQWKELRRRAIERRMGNKQSSYNTLLLSAALQDRAITGATYEKPKTVEHLDGVYWADEQPVRIPYKDTKKYMHVKPKELHHQQLEALMLEWGLTKRKAVHRIMMAALARGVRV